MTTSFQPLPRLFFFNLALSFGIYIALFESSAPAYFGIILTIFGLTFIPSSKIIQQFYFKLLLFFMLGATCTLLHKIYITKNMDRYQCFHSSLDVKVVSIDPLVGKQFKYKTIVALTPFLSAWILSHKKPRVNEGDIITLQNITFQPPTHESLFWMQKEKIMGTAFCKSLTFSSVPYKKSLFEKHQQSLSTQRKTTLYKIISALPTTTHILMRLIFFGNKEEIHPSNLQEMYQVFSWWGLSHFLARSGLHFVILIGLISFFLSFFNIKNRFKFLILIPFCFFYTLFTWVSVSYLRALITLLISFFLKLFSIKDSYIVILNSVYFIFLILNPYLLMSLDFQLSFLLTFTLVLSSSFLQPVKNKSTKSYSAPLNNR